VRKSSAVTINKNDFVNEDAKFSEDSTRMFQTKYIMEGDIKMLTLALQLKPKQAKFYF